MEIETNRVTDDQMNVISLSVLNNDYAFIFGDTT